MTKNDLTFGAALLAIFATIITTIALQAGRTPDATANHYAHAVVRQVQPKVAQADCGCVRVAQQTVR
jgi:hypothetical protein